MGINEFWLKIFTQKFKSEALIQNQSDDLVIKGYPSPQYLSIYRKKSSKIPKDSLNISYRNVARDTSKLLYNLFSKYRR
jgi:hypothetical protein